MSMAIVRTCVVSWLGSCVGGLVGGRGVSPDELLSKFIMPVCKEESALRMNGSTNKYRLKSKCVCVCVCVCVLSLIHI